VGFWHKADMPTRYAVCPLPGGNRTSFRDIDEHVVEAKGVGLELSNRCSGDVAVFAIRIRVFAILFVQAEVRHVLVGAPVLHAITPVPLHLWDRRRVATRGIFPLRLARQSVLVAPEQVHQPNKCFTSFQVTLSTRLRSLGTTKEWAPPGTRHGSLPRT